MSTLTDFRIGFIGPSQNINIKTNSLGLENVKKNSTWFMSRDRVSRRYVQCNC